MPLRLGWIGSAALLAFTSVWAGCTKRAAQPGASATVTIELASVEQGLYEPRATFRIVNASDHALAYQGYSGGVPVFRFALQSDGKWVERSPAWIECATGEAYFTLEPGAERMIEVVAQRPDLSLRVGVGTWTPAEGAPPDWSHWSWVWSQGVVVDDLLNASDG